MTELIGQPGELRFTIEIKRAATGETETYDLIGRITNDEEEVDTNGSNTLDRGA